MTTLITGRDTPPPRNEAELDDLLSRPPAGVVDALRRCPGDVAILGAGGKMGPTIARMVRRAADQAGAPRRVLAVSRFSARHAVAALSDAGVEVVTADLTDWASLAALPEVPNVIFLAGQKFGTGSAPSVTWVSNAIVPALVADRFRSARIVALSTGNVYPLTAVTGGGSREGDAPEPVGEYAWTCLGRERVLDHASITRGTRIAVVRLNYAVDLRYGVLVDLALKVAAGEPVDLRMGFVNVIWQGDASAQVIQCLPYAASPPFVLNVSGADTLSVRAAALELGRRLGRDPVFEGDEAADALLSDTSRARALFGQPLVSSDLLLSWVASWIAGGGVTLGKATHFQEREGRF